MYYLMYLEADLIMFEGSKEECERYYNKHYKGNKYYSIVSPQQYKEMHWDF